ALAAGGVGTRGAAEVGTRDAAGVGAREPARTETAESAVAVETSLPTPIPAEPVPEPVAVPRPRPRPTPPPRTSSSFQHRLSTLTNPRRTSVISNRRASTIDMNRHVSAAEQTNRRASTIEPGRQTDNMPRRRAMSMLGGTVRRFMSWRSGAERVEGSRGGVERESRAGIDGGSRGGIVAEGTEIVEGESGVSGGRGSGANGGQGGVEDVADYARAPPSPVSGVESVDIPVRDGTPVASSPTGTTTPAPLGPVPSLPIPPVPPPPPPISTLPIPPIPPTPISPISPIPPTPTRSSRPRSHPTTDAEDLVRFSHMLGFTPGAVHPPGSFERFLADMQDELRAALGEYQERTRVRRGRRERRSVDGGRSRSGGARRNSLGGESRISLEDERDRLDHTRPHVPSTDPLPLNWWRMYRFPSLPDVTVPASGPPASTITVGSGSTEAAGMSSSVTTSGTSSPLTAHGSSSPSTTPETSSPATEPDTEPPVPVHPAIIIGLRSVSRDPLDEAAAAATAAAAGAVPRAETRRASVDTESRRAGTDAGTGRTGADTEPRRSSMGDASWARRFGLRDEAESEDRRSRDGTRNYIIWIIGGYYPSNHPLLAHPNLFLGQVHPDELWMLNEFLGQVKPPTASREDIAKAGLRVIKGAQVGEYAKDGGVTENCTERCLICLDDYANEEDLRIMSCKHMFHKDCVDRWMETGRNNCPACRTKGVDTTSSPTPSTSTTTAQV
ncbi:hypothetical protein FRC07_012034, partial [Ceratobasidium sp. 392]